MTDTTELLHHLRIDMKGNEYCQDAADCIEKLQRDLSDRSDTVDRLYDETDRLQRELETWQGHAADRITDMARLHKTIEDALQLLETPLNISIKWKMLEILNEALKEK